MFIAVIAGKASVDFIRLNLGQQCNAVETLLAMRFDVITSGLNRLAREDLVLRFDFLKAYDVRIGFFQPRKEVFDASPNAIDVPGNDFHGGLSVSQIGRRFCIVALLSKGKLAPSAAGHNHGKALTAG